jgi:glycosyltransferase involved in cell wall biosynthesis
MKILFHHRIASRDGQSVHMDELCAALRQQGHTVIVVGPARTARIEFGSNAGVIAGLKQFLPRALYELMELAYNVVALFRLRAAIRRHRPDAIYERYNLFLFAGSLLSRLYSLPFLLEINAPLREERTAANGLSLQRLAGWAERTVWRSADFALPVTNVLAEHLRREGVDDHRIVVVPNGIDLAKFSDLPERAGVKAALGLGGKVVLGFTGFVRAWNSLERVIDLLPALTDTHLLLVGDGPARPDLECHASRLGVRDRVTATGIVQREAVRDLLAAFDIAMQPEATPYASPLKMFEYMAAGLAIVAPDRANIREVLTDRVDALLVDSNRPDELAAAITELCRDEDLRHQLGRAARNTISERGLTWINNAQIVAGLASQLLEKRSSQSVGTLSESASSIPSS